MTLRKNVKILHPDAKGRVTLGALAKGISSYRMTQDDQGRLVLEPYVEIAAHRMPGWAESQSPYTAPQEAELGQRREHDPARRGLIDFMETTLSEDAADIGKAKWAADKPALGQDFTE